MMTRTAMTEPRMMPRLAVFCVSRSVLLLTAGVGDEPGVVIVDELLGAGTLFAVGAVGVTALGVVVVVVVVVMGVGVVVVVVVVVGVVVVVVVMAVIGDDADVVVTTVAFDGDKLHKNEL